MRLVVVGGGTAGWLAASLIAARVRALSLQAQLSVTLVESDEIPTVGVGEGTWPSMRSTLEQIGINESDFLSSCNASFKQGSEFRGWSGLANDFYIHPFTTPFGYGQMDVHSLWASSNTAKSFSEFVSPQATVSQHFLAPKQPSMPDYAGALNYGYHLDAGAFANLLAEHATNNLGVKRFVGTITRVTSDAQGNVASILIAGGLEIGGDFFIDCSGRNSLIMKNHYGIADVSFSKYIFNDAAIAVHVPVEEQEPINSTTIATAWDSGWIWDIGLQSRRGVGVVYSKSHASEDQAYEKLLGYISSSSSASSASSTARSIGFDSGHLKKLWHKNCVAIGMSAGFIEPLEASAIAMIELACNWLCAELPLDKDYMPILEKRFNERFLYRWGKILTFLKLHYAISARRDSQYWIDSTADESLNDELKEMLKLWAVRPPCFQDFVHNEEVFPSASYQYVLYGMGFKTQVYGAPSEKEIEEYEQTVEGKTNQLMSLLSKNRNLLSY